MGAVFFSDTYVGDSLSSVYRKAKEDAEYEYGTDPYNGTISTTHHLLDVTEEFKRSGKSLQEFMDDKEENGKKWHCYAVCIEKPIKEDLKVKTKVEHIVEKGTKKWLLKYVVYDYEHEGMLATKDTKGEAVEFARRYTEKTRKSTYIEMEKVLEKGEKRVAKVTFKTSKNDRPGKWVLFGLASS